MADTLLYKEIIHFDELGIFIHWKDAHSVCTENTLIFTHLKHAHIFMDWKHAQFDVHYFATYTISISQL